MMHVCVSFMLISWIAGSANGYETNQALAQILSTKISGTEQFPEYIELQFTYEGNDVHLNLAKDDQTTKMLSPGVTDASYFLPNGLLDDGNKHEYAVYSPGGEDIVLVHRPSASHTPRFFGRYSDNEGRRVIQSHEDDLSLLYSRTDTPRDDHEGSRRRRDIDDEDGILELFMFADLSVFEYILLDVLPMGTTEEAKAYLNDYMSTIVKDVDDIYNGYGTNGTVKLRVHYMQYQIITASDEQTWMDTSISTDTFDEATVISFQTYYATLESRFAFPAPDHLMQITRYDIGTSYLTSGSICGTSPSIAASIVSTSDLRTNMAAAIGITLGLQLDSDTACDDDAHYVMSSFQGPTDNPSNRGNRWLFSSCSTNDLSGLFVGTPACLVTEDILFEFNNSTVRLGDLYTADQQCQFEFGSSSSVCGEVDCYSATGVCSNNSMCVSYSFGQNTLCSIGVCEYGFCSGTTTTSTTTASTTSVTETTTTDDSGRMTTTESECIVQTGYVEFDLPGCGCCGGCGCDDTCTDCDPGLPSYTQSDSCTPAPDCCGSKVRVTTLFVPDGCPHNYVEGPKTVIMEKNGWENPETEVTAEVYQDNADRWQVKLVPEN